MTATATVPSSVVSTSPIAAFEQRWRTATEDARTADDRVGALERERETLSANLDAAAERGDAPTVVRLQLRQRRLPDEIKAACTARAEAVDPGRQGDRGDRQQKLLARRDPADRRRRDGLLADKRTDRVLCKNAAVHTRW